jgi:peptide/nickel transport system substrate-binding protein
VQKILAHDMPTINLWYLDTVLVHNRRLQNLHLSPSGNYDFLRDATLKE